MKLAHGICQMSLHATDVANEIGFIYIIDGRNHEIIKLQLIELNFQTDLKNFHFL